MVKALDSLVLARSFSPRLQALAGGQRLNEQLIGHVSQPAEKK